MTGAGAAALNGPWFEVGRARNADPSYASGRSQQEILQEMFESAERFNEGLVSFEYPLYFAEDSELDYFLGSLVSKVARAAKGVAKTVGRTLSAVDKVVPVSLLTGAINLTPLGIAARAGLGAMQAAAEGRNVFQGTMRSLAGGLLPGHRLWVDPIAGFSVDTGLPAARGENILKAAVKAAQAGIGDIRKGLQFAAMVSGFVPGVGTGVSAALSAANALAAGQPITDALISAARGSLPGGAAAQFAFDTAMNMAKGKNVAEALLTSARSRLPGGPAAQAAFDAALALAKGKSIQDAAFAAAGRLLPPSPYAADALSFVRKVASGQNIQKAALSIAANSVLKRIHAQGGPVLSSVRARLPEFPTRRPGSPFAMRSFAPSIVRPQRWPVLHRKPLEIGSGPLGVESHNFLLDLEQFPSSRSSQQDMLQAMYDSPELLNEGLLSFSFPLYEADDQELDYFLGSLIHKVAKAAGSVARTAGSVAKTVGKGISAVEKVVPDSVLTSALSWTPAGMAARAALGALKAAGEGRNVFQGAIRSLARDPVTRFYVDTATAAARGQNILKAAQQAAQAGIGDLRQSLQFAAMVAPFIPGIGTGVAAALSAANALAAGQPITEALIAAARGALPGGAIAQVAFDTAMNLAKGKNFGEALLDSARSKLPGGPAAQAAFDAALALAKGKSIQDAAFAAAGRLLPPSPYAADALSFVKKIAGGQNIQRAALSTAGNLILNRIQAQVGPVISSRIPQTALRLAAARPRTVLRGAISRARELPLLENESHVARASESALIRRLISAGHRHPYELTDAVFYQRHPELRGRRIGPRETRWKQEWLAILRRIVNPLLAANSASVPGGVQTQPASDSDVAFALAIARKPIPGNPSVTVQQLIELWRPQIAPEIPISVLLAFIRFESGGNFSDATHGSPRQRPPYTQPEFYELGLFQTPSGLHGACTSGDPASCAIPPPGREVAGAPSTWARLCKRIGADPQDWRNPATQVRVGLLDLKTGADAIRAAYPDLFPTIGSDWYIRAAVLLPFARGGGFTRAFLKAYRNQLVNLPEDQRWDFLREKRVIVRGGQWVFDAANVDKKIALAVKIGRVARL